MFIQIPCVFLFGTAIKGLISNQEFSNGGKLTWENHCVVRGNALNSGEVPKLFALMFSDK